MTDCLKISEVIAELEKLKAESGDLFVRTVNTESIFSLVFGNPTAPVRMVEVIDGCERLESAAEFVALHDGNMIERDPE